MTNTTPIFTDEILQQLFELNGYVVIDLLSKNSLQELNSLYNKVPRKNLSFESSSFLDDSDFLSSINNEVVNVIEKQLNSYLLTHKKLGTSFLTKKSGDNSFMPIHQDWTVVDESKFSSVTCWIPMTDTVLENGAMQVIPGSHKFSNALRSPSLPISFQGIYDDIKPLLKTISLKAGQALVFNQALWHASLSNLSGKDRVAVTYGFTHESADLFMYYYQDGVVEKWRMPDDMFLNYSKIINTPTIGEKIDSFYYTVPKLSAQDVYSAAYHVRKNKSMKPLFINKEHQIFFEQNGYLILPALDANDIEALKSFYFSLGLKDEKGYGFHVGMDNEDKQLVTEMVNTIKSVALPKIQPHLVDTQLFTASFVIKESNPQGVVPPHQDWSFVEDEDKYCSVTCWIPLQDVNMENGCMGVIKGSHHFFDAFRASPSPQVGTPLKDHMFTIFPFLQLIEMKAGEALIFNNKTIHASPPNTTNEPRLAVGLGFTQKEANICHYYLKPGSTDKVLKYNIDPHFFFKYDNSKLSRMYDEGKLIEGYGNPEEVEFNFENLSAEDFTKRITEAGNSYNASLVSTMAKLFNYNADGTEKSGSTSQDEKIEISISNSDQNDETIIPFWKVYTPLNVIREIKHRLTSKL